MRKILTIIIILSSFVLSAQDTTYTKKEIIITTDIKIDSMVNARCKKKDYPMVPGWRIELDFSDNKEKLKETRMKFIKYHPEIETYIEYDSPIFHLRVGNFENIEDAEILMDEIRQHYRVVSLLETMVYQKK
jgi:hypothetical protein